MLTTFGHLACSHWIIRWLCPLEPSTHLHTFSNHMCRSCNPQLTCFEPLLSVDDRCYWPRTKWDLSASGAHCLPVHQCKQTVNCQLFAIQALAPMLALTHACPCALQVNLNVTCQFVRDVLWGDEVSELRLKLISQGTENYPFKDDD